MFQVINCDICGEGLGNGNVELKYVPKADQCGHCQQFFPVSTMTYFSCSSVCLNQLIDAGIPCKLCYVSKSRENCDYCKGTGYMLQDNNVPEEAEKLFFVKDCRYISKFLAAKC